MFKLAVKQPGLCLAHSIFRCYRWRCILGGERCLRVSLCFAHPSKTLCISERESRQLLFGCVHLPVSVLPRNLCKLLLFISEFPWWTCTNSEQFWVIPVYKLPCWVLRSAEKLKITEATNSFWERDFFFLIEDKLNKDEKWMKLFYCFIHVEVI